MPRVSVHYAGVSDLASDLRKIPALAVRDMRATVREAGKVGNQVAKDNARRTEGTHGKHYHRAFTWETGSFLGFGGGNYTTTYGPDAARPQGGMSFEDGSVNQPAHNDLAKSADLMGPSFAQEVGQLPDRWFWPA